MSIVCGKIYKDFFKKIKNMTFEMNEFISCVSESIPDIAKALNIGKCTETFTAPQTNFNINGISSTVVFYDSKDNFDDRPETFMFRTGEGGSLHVTFYPVKGHTWNEDELDDIEFIAENLFILGARVQILNSMRKISITDISTGAANMNGFNIHCEKLLKQGKFSSFATIFINIKNFKFVNRIIGERQADGVLRMYAHKLMNFMSSDEKLAHPGGDNFFALISKDRIDEFFDFLLNISFEINSPDNVSVINIQSRAGAYAIKEGDSVEFAVGAASTTLNIVKKSGHCDVMWFRKDMIEKSIKAHEVSNIFPEALKNEEFLVYYQPKVSLTDNRLCGCEALTRWIRNGKIVSPADFIPILESEGTICRLDFYILDKVCADIKRWLDSGIEPVRVSTNFSKLHLHNVNLAEQIIATISKHGIDSSYVEIELTESSGYEDYEALAAFVHKMKSYGVSTSIDDFGTGYSSLNLLKDLDVDIIKLDKSFLDNLGDENTSDQVVIRNIVNMVNELDMKVVAEGVETNLQAQLLENFSCSMAQGYLFDRPLPCAEFEERLKSNRFYSEKRE